MGRNDFIEDSRSFQPMCSIIFWDWMSYRSQGQRSWVSTSREGLSFSSPGSPRLRCRIHHGRCHVGRGASQDRAVEGTRPGSRLCLREVRCRSICIANRPPGASRHRAGTAISSIRDITRTPPTRVRSGGCRGPQAPKTAAVAPIRALCDRNKSGGKPPLSSNPRIRDGAANANVWPRPETLPTGPGHQRGRHRATQRVVRVRLLDAAFSDVMAALRGATDPAARVDQHQERCRPGLGTHLAPTSSGKLGVMTTAPEVGLLGRGSTRNRTGGLHPTAGAVQP